MATYTHSALLLMYPSLPHSPQNWFTAAGRTGRGVGPMALALRSVYEYYYYYYYYYFQAAPKHLSTAVILLLLHKTTLPIRLLARESFRNVISKLQNIVYGILLVNHVLYTHKGTIFSGNTFRQYFQARKILDKYLTWETLLFVVLLVVLHG
jgi:hypothetical protein